MRLELELFLKKIEDLKVKIFADGANKNEMLDMHKKPFIKGLTTNPTLMKKAGIKNYKAFCKDILSSINDKPISFEVFSDDLLEMERQALEIASWANNVYVKIPVTNTSGNYTYELIKKLTDQKVKINVTAVMTINQVSNIVDKLNKSTPSYISVFAGRIADTGIDPLPLLSSVIKIIKSNPLIELIWASPRELLNIFQADSIDCHIITVSNEIIRKLHLVGYDLDKYSLETVKMFYEDAIKAEFKL